MSRKVVLTLLLVAAAGLGVTRFITASDHKDSMLLAGDPAADIADMYTFRSPTNPANVVLAMIQAFVTGTGGHQVMHFRGPAKASEIGSTTRVIEGPETATVAVSNTATPIAATRNGMTVFAGVRDDPFFFDLVQFKKIIAGQATSFRNPGVDTFAGTNVLAIVVELPSSMLGGTKLGVWGSTSRPQL